MEGQRRRPRSPDDSPPADVASGSLSASALPDTSPTPVIAPGSQSAAGSQSTDAAPAVRVQGSPLRCPFCHDQVDPAAADWVACRACLARHHSACWGEGGACGACGSDHRLVMEASRPGEGGFVGVEADEVDSGLDSQAWAGEEPGAYWRERARQRAAAREPREARRGGSGRAAPRPSARRRAVPRGNPIDDPVQRYMALQACWALLASGLAIAVHPWLALIGGGLGLLSTVQLRLEARHDSSLTWRPTALSALLVVISFAGAAHALLTETSQLASALLALVGLCAFALGVFWRGRPRR